MIIAEAGSVVELQPVVADGPIHTYLVKVIDLSHLACRVCSLGTQVKNLQQQLACSPSVKACKPQLQSV
jgi:hypothetical protein